MASLNKVLLIGNLTRDPELRYAPNGTAVCTFSLAISRIFNSTAGSKKEEVCFVRVVCWAKLAQICSEYLFKGRPVFVEGRLQSRSWQANDGTKRSTIEVIAQTVQFLGKGKSHEAAGPEEEPGISQHPVDTVSEDTPDLANLTVPDKHDEEIPF